MSKVILDERTRNSLIDVLADESVIKTEAIRDILKGKGFKYNSIMRDDSNEDTEEVFEPVKRSEQPKVRPRQSAIKSKPIEKEIVVDVTKGNYEEPKDPVDAMKPVGHIKELSKEELAAMHLAESNKLTKILILLLPSEKEFKDSINILNRYTAKLNYDETGHATNMSEVINLFKKDFNIEV